MIGTGERGVLQGDRWTQNPSSGGHGQGYTLLHGECPGSLAAPARVPPCTTARGWGGGGSTGRRFQGSDGNLVTTGSRRSQEPRSPPGWPLGQGLSTPSLAGRGTTPGARGGDTAPRQPCPEDRSQELKGDTAGIIGHRACILAAPPSPRPGRSGACRPGRETPVPLILMEAFQMQQKRSPPHGQCHFRDPFVTLHLVTPVSFGS